MTLFFFLFGLFVLWFFNAEYERERNNRRLAEQASMVRNLPFTFKYAFHVQCAAQAEQWEITQ